MKYLVHCILRNEANPPSRPRVTLVASGNLAAAVTFCDGETAPVEATQLLEYERAISALHEHGPVIPLRYGCLVADEAAVLRLLDEHRAQYETLLRRLEDRVEMGLRVLWDSSENIEPAPAPDTLGALYLAAARRRHSLPMDLTLAEREWAGGICAELANFYSEETREARFAGSARLISLYFLVHRAAISDFRERLRQIVSGQGRRFLVSGPWPPYNFVTGAAS